MAKKENNLMSFKDLLGTIDTSIKGTSIMRETEKTSKKRGTISTGIYVLNAAMSGSLYGGISDNRITILGGPSACLFPSEKINIYVMKTKKCKNNIHDESIQSKI